MQAVIKELGKSVQYELDRKELQNELNIKALPGLQKGFLEYMDNRADKRWTQYWHLYEFGHGPTRGNPERLFVTKYEGNFFRVYFRQAKRATPLTEYQKEWQHGGHVFRMRVWILEQGSDVTIKSKKSHGILAPKQQWNPNLPWFFDGPAHVSFSKMRTVGSFHRAAEMFRHSWANTYINNVSRGIRQDKTKKIASELRSAYDR